MKAAFTLIPSESRRLIAKAVVQMKEVKIARKKAYIILGGGTTNGYIAQELLGKKDLDRKNSPAGTSTHRLLCVTDPEKRLPIPIVLYKGEMSSKTPVRLSRIFTSRRSSSRGKCHRPGGKCGNHHIRFRWRTFAQTYGPVSSQGLNISFRWASRRWLPRSKKQRPGPVQRHSITRWG